jgi:hypothetical protein
MDQKFARLIFILSIIFLVVAGSFTYGLVVGAYNIWPYPFISRMKQAVVSLYQTKTISPVNQVITAPPYASRERVQLAPELNIPGFLAIMGYDHTKAHDVIWLLDETGKEHHVWPIHYDLIDPDGPSHGSDAPHGLQIMNDGSVILNFELGDAMTRLDTCGKPIWIKEGIYHHQIEFNEQMEFWTWQADDHPFSQFQYLVKIDPQTGETLQRISLKDDVILKSPQNALVFSIPPGFEFTHFDGEPNALDQDIFHPNDIEELTTAMAVHFPQFVPGDLLISLRHLDLIAVLDSHTYSVKWARHGPWRYQHDPDFTEDGTISVYDNNKGHQFSKIMEVDPETGKTWYRFPRTEFEYNNSSMGTHQRLPHGGELISVPMEGRVLVINPDGKVAFEFNNIMSKEFNANVQNAMWLPRDFFQVPPSCP